MSCSARWNSQVAGIRFCLFAINTQTAAEGHTHKDTHTHRHTYMLKHSSKLIWHRIKSELIFGNVDILFSFVFLTKPHVGKGIKSGETTRSMVFFMPCLQVSLFCSRLQFQLVNNSVVWHGSQNTGVAVVFGRGSNPF